MDVYYCPASQGRPPWKFPPRTPRPICRGKLRWLREPRAAWAAARRWRSAQRGSAEARKALPADYYKNRPETIEETAELVSARGGKGIAVVVDHLQAAQVEKLIARIRKEQRRLHVLVNDISESAEHEFGKTFWQADLERGFAMYGNAVHTHIITSHFAAPLLIETAKGKSGSGLIVEIGDGDSYVYRGHLFFDMIKTTVIRQPFALARELGRKNVAAVAADPEIMKKSGLVFSSWVRSDEYGFCDAEGRRPHWGRYFTEKYGECMKPCDEKFYQYWFGGPIDTIYANWP